MASCLVKSRKKTFLVGSVVHLITMATFFWDCTFPPFVELRSQPEFLPLMSNDRTHWPSCLLWRGWLPGLSSRTLGTPWAISSSDLAGSCLENALRPYPLSASSAWRPFWDQEDVQDMVDDVPDDPNIWTDGSREPIPHLDVEIAGAGAFIHSPAIVFDSHHWVMLRILMTLMKVALTFCRVFLAPFSLFSVLNIGESFLLCKLILVFILVLTI